MLPELSTAEAKDKFPKGVEVYKVPSEREYMRFVRRAPRPPAPWLPRAAATERTYKYTASDSCATLLSADTRPAMSSAAGMRVCSRSYASACPQRSVASWYALTLGSLGGVNYTKISTE